MLTIKYRGYGLNIPLGTLTLISNSRYQWKWSNEALHYKLDLSPVHLPLGSDIFQDFPLGVKSIPGLIYDSLPDGWGLLLQDRWLKRQNLPLTPINRLMALGDNAMGALSFEPSTTLPKNIHNSLQEWFNQCTAVMTGEIDSVLQSMISIGGSPQGARPKVTIFFDKEKQQVTNSGDSWLFKFPHYQENKDVTALEAAYATIAKQGHLTMTDHTYIQWLNGSAFGTKRFDRNNDIRLPIHSAAALLHADFRTPSAFDYKTLINLVGYITRSDEDIKEMFSRAVFNVVFHNRDDHGKNIAFIWQKEGGYRLAPAFDLTFSDGPSGEHHTDFYGNGNPTWKEINQLANDNNISTTEAINCVENWLMLANDKLPLLFKNQYPISKVTLKDIKKVLNHQYHLCKPPTNLPSNKLLTI